MLEIRKSLVEGRGCFAKEYIPANTLFKYSVIVFDRDSVESPTPTSEYHFPWSGKKSSIVCGEASFCNHSKLSNLQIHSIDRLDLTKTFRATRNIEKDEELFLYYGA